MPFTAVMTGRGGAAEAPVSMLETVALDATIARAGACTNERGGWISGAFLSAEGSLLFMRVGVAQGIPNGFIGSRRRSRQLLAIENHNQHAKAIWLRVFADLLRVRIEDIPGELAVARDCRLQALIITD